MADTVVYDADGNEVKGVVVLPAEEAKKQKEQADKVVGLESTLKERETALAARDADLKKFQAKDFNWRQFEQAKEDEKAKMMEGFSEEKKEWIRGRAEDKQQVDRLSRTILDERKNIILEALAGKDVDLKKQIEETAKQWAGEPQDAKEMQERYVNAFTLIKGHKPKVNDMFRFSPMSDAGGGGGDGSKFTESAEGQAAYNRYFPNNTFTKKK